LSLEGYLLLRDGTLVKGYALGQPGLYLGQLSRFTGPFDPQLVMTDPASKGQILLSDQPEIGSLGVRPGLDQSDTIHASGLMCRDLVDFPSYRGNFKAISQMLSRGGSASISSLDLSSILPFEGSDAAALVIQGERLDLDMIAFIEASLKAYTQDTGYHPPSGYAKRTHHPHSRSDDHILVLDLGIRDGLLRALRKEANVAILQPSALSDISLEDPDRALISSGPGALPDDEMVRTVSGFLSMFSHVPVMSMGIGALAMDMALGGTPDRMSEPHRGTDIEVRLGDLLLPTYQNHEYSLSPLNGFEVMARGPGGSIEVLVSTDGPLRMMSTMDTLPEFGSVDGDPLSLFLRWDRS
jgi:carbamoyl-phosphate synthase small subunit